MASASRVFFDELGRGLGKGPVKARSWMREGQRMPIRLLFFFLVSSITRPNGLGMPTAPLMSKTTGPARRARKPGGNGSRCSLRSGRRRPTTAWPDAPSDDDRKIGSEKILGRTGGVALFLPRSRVGATRRHARAVSAIMHPHRECLRSWKPSEGEAARCLQIGWNFKIRNT